MRHDKRIWKVELYDTDDGSLVYRTLWTSKQKMKTYCKDWNHPGYETKITELEGLELIAARRLLRGDN